MMTRYNASVEDHSALLVLWKADELTEAHADSLWIKTDEVREAVWRFLDSHPFVPYQQILSQFPEVSEYLTEKDSICFRCFDPNPATANSGLWGALWPSKMPAVVMTALSASYENYTKELTALRRQLKTNYPTSIPCVLIFGHGDDAMLESGEYRVTPPLADDDQGEKKSKNFEDQLVRIFEHVAVDVVQFVTSRVRALASCDFDDVKLPSGDIAIDKKDRQLVARHTAVRAAKIRADRLLSIGCLNGAAQQIAAIEHGLLSTSVGSNAKSNGSASMVSSSESMFLRNESMIAAPLAVPLMQVHPHDPLQPVWSAGLLDTLAGLRFAQSRAFLDSKILASRRAALLDMQNRLAEDDGELSSAEKALISSMETDAINTLRGLLSIRGIKVKIMSHLSTLRPVNEFEQKIEAAVNDFRSATSVAQSASQALSSVMVLYDAFEALVDKLVMEIVALLRGARGFYAFSRTTLPTVAELEIECLLKRARLYAKFGMPDQCRESIAKLSEKRPNASALDRVENFSPYLPELWRQSGFVRLALREEAAILISGQLTVSMKRWVSAMLELQSFNDPLPPDFVPIPQRHAGRLFLDVYHQSLTAPENSWLAVNKLRIASALMRLFPARVDKEILDALRANAENAILITPPPVLVFMKPEKLPPDEQPNEELIHRGTFLVGGPPPFFFCAGQFVKTRVVWCSDSICTLTLALRNPLTMPIVLCRMVPYAVDATTGLEVLDMQCFADDAPFTIPVCQSLSMVTIALRPPKSCEVLRIIGLKAQWNGQLFYFAAPHAVDVPLVHNFPRLDLSLNEGIAEIPIFSGMERTLLLRLQNCGAIDADKVCVSVHTPTCSSDACGGCTERRHIIQGVEACEVTCAVERPRASSARTDPSSVVQSPSAAVRSRSPMRFSLSRGSKTAVRLVCSVPAFLPEDTPPPTTFIIRVQYGRDFVIPDISQQLASRSKADKLRSVYVTAPVRTFVLRFVARPTIGVISRGENFRGGRFLEVRVFNANETYSAVFGQPTVEQSKSAWSYASGSIKELPPRTDGSLLIVMNASMFNAKTAGEQLHVPWSLVGLPNGTGWITVSVAAAFDDLKSSSSFKEKLAVGLVGSTLSGSKWRWESSPFETITDIMEQIPPLPLLRGIPVTLLVVLNGFGEHQPNPISVDCRFLDGESVVSGRVKTTIGSTGDGEYALPLEALFTTQGTHVLDVVLRETSSSERVVTFAIPLQANDAALVEEEKLTELAS